MGATKQVKEFQDIDCTGVIPISQKDDTFFREYFQKLKSKQAKEKVKKYSVLKNNSRN